MHLPARQRGITLLVLIALVSLTIIFAYVSGLTRSASSMSWAREQKTAIALAQAKEALIAYAVTYMDTHANQVPGYLPCPDYGLPIIGVIKEGTANGNCPASGASSLVSVIGKLPWKTLDLDALQDGSDECLWYAVSGTYKNNPNGVSGDPDSSNMMNWDTNGQFKVMDSNGSSFLAGSSADNRAVAVIFAPGAPLSGQDRTPDPNYPACGGNYNAAAYLDSATVNGVTIDNSSLVTPSSPPSVDDVSTFIAAKRSSSFNDKLVYITRADIWNAIKKRSDFNNRLRALTRRAAECTAMYGTKNSNGLWDKRVPWGSSLSLSGSSVPAYAVNEKYNDSSGAEAGRLSFKVDSSRSATNNDIANSLDYGLSKRYLFNLEYSSNGSYCAYTAEEKLWYDNWKDQLFYAVANSYKPSGPSWVAPWNCPTCLSINGSGSYAAVVIFAGEKLSGQSRNTASDKGLIANYLEGRNSSNYPNNSGNGNYQAAAASATFNDIVYAINSYLNVSCSDTAGAMRSLATAPAAPPAPANLAAYGACP